MFLTVFTIPLKLNERVSDFKIFTIASGVESSQTDIGDRVCLFHHAR